MVWKLIWFMTHKKAGNLWAAPLLPWTEATEGSCIDCHLVETARALSGGWDRINISHFVNKGFALALMYVNKWLGVSLLMGSHYFLTNSASLIAFLDANGFVHCGSHGDPKRLADKCGRQRLGCQCTVNLRGALLPWTIHQVLIGSRWSPQKVSPTADFKSRKQSSFPSEGHLIERPRIIWRFSAEHREEEKKARRSGLEVGSRKQPLLPETKQRHHHGRE